MTELKKTWLFLVAMLSSSVAFATTPSHHVSDNSAKLQGNRRQSKDKERVYLLDDRPFSPIEIITDPSGASKTQGRRKVTVLRDPGFTPTQEKVIKKPDAKRVAKAGTPVSRKKTIKFHRVMVKGYHTEPRVEFSAEPIELERSDEPLPGDFLSRTFEDERNL